MDKIKKICLDMAKEAIKICEENNLQYYMLGGTLLGAVRHEGFIPWDDDIDLGMPRKDYEKFMQIAPSILSENLKLQKFDDKDSRHYFIKIVNKNTKIIKTSNKNNDLSSIWIDIFPLDGMPNNTLIRKIHQFRLLYRKMMIQFSDFENRINLNISNRPLHEKILISLAMTTRVGKYIDTNKMLLKVDKALRKYDYDKCDYLVNFFGAYKFKEMFPKKYYGKGKLYKFEDIKMNGPIEYDLILKQMYGDYMKLPPKDERENHHTFEVIEL